MSAESVGQIGLDLVVNKNNFEKQMGGVQKLAAKAGKALAAAFAVKKLISFGNACIELGSDLQEVQNVVDVTFPSMSKKVDEFAQNAAASFGLSETMAKKFTGTFGAMAIVGFFIKKDLSIVGRALIMLLIGIIIATVVNIFLHSSGLALILNYLGVLVFTGLTAYDSQKIKEMMLAASEQGVTDQTQKLALLGSLSLYLDFINLFLYLLRIFGDRK